MGLKLKVTSEDQERRIPYLDTVIGVDKYNQIYICWYQTPCSWKRILDFHSNHPFNMKANIVKQLITNALRVTSPNYWENTIDLVSGTLRNSNYSRKFIKSQVFLVRQNIGTVSITSECGNPERSFDIVGFARDFKHAPRIMERSKYNSSRYISNRNNRRDSTRMTVRTRPMLKSKTKQNQHQMRYIRCPFYPPLIRFLNDRMRNNDLIGVTLAPSTIRTNRKLVFTTTKCKKLKSDRINASFDLICKKCDFGVKIRTNYQNIEKTVLHFKRNEGSMINEHMRLHPRHVFCNPKNVRCFNSRRELNMSCSYECERINVRDRYV